MFVEICLALIALFLFILVLFLATFFYTARQSMESIKVQAEGVSAELISLTRSVHQFVEGDLHPVSQEASQLIGKLSNLSSDIHEKSHSLNILFQPLGFLTEKLGNQETFPRLIKWALSSALLFKTTKELVKRYGK